MDTAEIGRIRVLPLCAVGRHQAQELRNAEMFAVLGYQRIELVLASSVALGAGDDQDIGAGGNLTQGDAAGHHSCTARVPVGGRQPATK